MNHSIFVVKVIEKPVRLIYKGCQSIEIKVKFPAPRQKNSKNELTLLIWGDDKDDFVKYYKIQDYLIIEGTLTSKGYINDGNDGNEVKIIVKKFYPFLLI
uniref:Ycf41 n=2 Tax=Alaria TaxID=2888 RepID=A0A8E8PFU3_9PHAE|nr:Ycf41 [Alaria crispa]YP_010206861.1 Ycf41 [Alaria esculenta]UAX22022.1 Ycf41 [Alaria sp. PI001]UAX22163.1 Ycf41 [Alaria sp. PI20]UAX22586.1 Ycf41 [Alaria sp. TTB000023]UAX22727.1 Ycf41 [Alaria sp. TTB000026]UAX22868.1 Ycf41 [Alaria sp. TTB000053]